MTAPNGPILFNSSTGSDTAASGLGPATAVTGSGASTTSASAVVTGIDTTGVSAGHLLWVQSTSGRQFSIIATVDSGTQVTCDDVFANTEASRTWAIGGKRATLAGSLRIIDSGGASDAKGGWTLEFPSGHAETFSSQIVIRAGGSTTEGAVVIRGEANAAVKPIFTQSSNTTFFLVNANHIAIKDLEFRNTHPTKTISIAVFINSDTLQGILLSGLVINHVTDKYWKGVRLQGRSVRVFRCSIGSCVNVGIEQAAGGGFEVLENTIFGCGSHGIHTGGGYTIGFSIRRNIIRGNTGDGINFRGTNNESRDHCTIDGNVIYDNGESGIEIATATVALPTIVNNIITENGDYGIKSSVGAAIDDALSQIVDHNAYHANTSGMTSGVSTEANAIELTADPFVNAAAGDFNINDTANGGALLRAATVVLP